MRIYTRIVIDCDGRILDSDSFEYQGPLALCDRALTQSANQAGQNATVASGQYGANAQGIQGNVVPRLEQYSANGGPGYGAIGEGQMETEAAQTTAAATGSAAERARLRAMRTNNAGAVGATDAAAAGEAARAGGSTLQQILAKNATLKSQQQGQATTELGNIMGEDIRGQSEEARLVPEDINAGIEAGKSGWLQNALNTFSTLSQAGNTAAKTAMGG